MPSMAVKHEYQCVDCGYGAVASIAPLRCPMCGAGVWELGRRGVVRTLADVRHPQPDGEESLLVVEAASA
jgi:DNA-directed RNA polymerase subunit RPC12/RpoP